ncbi:MAG TPA: hypothetical protein VF590_18410 [Isosphaeraceae bacterium]
MSVRVPCPNPDCRQPAEIEAWDLGRPRRCGRCGREFTPELSSAAEAAPSPPPGPDPGWSPSRPADRAVGALFAGRYQIRATLGRGGQGAVFLAMTSGSTATWRGGSRCSTPPRARRPRSG